jgi:deoxyribonuclease-4
MPAKFVGAHMPGAKGMAKAVRSGKEIGCTAVQVFTSSPQNWHAPELTEKGISDFDAARRDTGIKMIVSHDGYLINLCAPDPALREKSIEGLEGEIGRCSQYGIRWTVSHVGAHMGQGEEAGLELAADGIRRVLGETPEAVTLLMETTAGQGSSLNYKFEHLAKLLELCRGAERLCVCLDTCHVFAAGYDIGTPEGYMKTMDEFGRLVGFDRLKAVHCNDSKKPLGSRVDRHEHIGKGHIGEGAFRMLLQDPRFESIPILLETPEAETMHAVNLKKLHSFMRKRR